MDQQREEKIRQDEVNTTLEELQHVRTLLSEEIDRINNQNEKTAKDCTAKAIQLTESELRQVTEDLSKAIGSN